MNRPFWCEFCLSKHFQIVAVCARACGCTMLTWVCRGIHFFLATLIYAINFLLLFYQANQKTSSMFTACYLDTVDEQIERMNGWTKWKTIGININWIAFMQNLFKLNAHKIHSSKFSRKMFIAFSLHNKSEMNAKAVCTICMHAHAHCTVSTRLPLPPIPTSMVVSWRRTAVE